MSVGSIWHFSLILVLIGGSFHKHLFEVLRLASWKPCPTLSKEVRRYSNDFKSTESESKARDEATPRVTYKGF